MPEPRRSERDVDGDGNAGMMPVIHVVAVIDVINVDVVGFIPGARPVFRPRIDNTEPEAPVLESRIASHHNHRGAVNSEPASAAKVIVEADFGNAVAPVAATLAPGMMFMLPMRRAMALPRIPPGVLFVLTFVFKAADLAYVLRLMRLLWMRLVVTGLFPFRPAPRLVMLFVRGLLMHMLRASLAALVRMLRSGISVVLLMTVVVVF